MRSILATFLACFSAAVDRGARFFLAGPSSTGSGAVSSESEAASEVAVRFLDEARAGSVVSMLVVERVGVWVPCAGSSQLWGRVEGGGERVTRWNLHVEPSAARRAAALTAKSGNRNQT